MDGRECCFGKVVNTAVVLSETGAIVNECWHSIRVSFPNVDLDDLVIMPNHLHCIILLNEENRRGLINQTPTEDPCNGNWPLMRVPGIHLGKVIRYFKAKSARMIHLKGFPSFKWQRNYYEHVIRNNADLERIRKYICNNPLQWALDEENPENPSPLKPRL